MCEFPRISYVIPTRNRPDLLERALCSVLRQTRCCYEIVVSDNSDEKYSLAVRDVLARNKSEFVRYIRPASVLSMTAHWEWAVQHATGDYVGILTDRMFLKPHAVATLGQAILAASPSLLTYLHDAIEDKVSPVRFKRWAYSGEIFTIPSTLVIEAARRGRMSRMWPRMLNSLCRREVLDEVRAAYGQVFSGLAPDYSFCFRILDHLQSFSLVDARILVSAGKHRSNGGNFIRGSSAGDAGDFLKLGRESEGEIVFDGFLPWTSPVPNNVELIEYERARCLQKSGAYREVLRSHFYHRARRRISQLKSSGIETARHEHDIDRYRVENNLCLTHKLVHDVGIAKISNALRVRLAKAMEGSTQCPSIHTIHATIEEALSVDSTSPFRVKEVGGIKRILRMLDRG